MSNSRQYREMHMLFDLVTWQGSRCIAARLTINEAKAKARAWNSGKPSQQWVIWIPTRGGKVEVAA